MSLQLLYTRSLALVMTLVLVTATTDDSGPPVNITAHLGGTAKFRCHAGKREITVTRLYIQKFVNGIDTESTEIFINGFDVSRKLDVLPKYQNRTKVNQEELSMDMTNISVSDEGLYLCYIFHGTKDRSTVLKPMPQIYLKVKANYSLPTIERECSERKHPDGAVGKSCQLSCSSVGGYPQDAVTWLGLNTSRMGAVYNNSSEDQSSKTWTINQTITYNCDHPTNVSCAIRDAVSPTITICETESFSLKVIAAIAVVLLVLLLLLVFMVKHCCRRRQNSEGDSDPEEANVPLADCHSQLKSV